jgi:hypothetical protein
MLNNEMIKLRDEMTTLLARQDLHTLVLLKRYDGGYEGGTYAVHLFGDDDEDGSPTLYCVGLMSTEYLTMVAAMIQAAEWTEHVIDDSTDEVAVRYVTNNILPIEWHSRPDVVRDRVLLYTRPGHDLAEPDDSLFRAKYPEYFATETSV